METHKIVFTTEKMEALMINVNNTKDCSTELHDN
jgi:hypothetical protein